MNRYDIIVVGAGPAGAAAAAAAAAGGRRVCLLERKSRVGFPVRCGEGIGDRGLRFTLEPRPEWLLASVTRAAMVSPSGTRVVLGDIGQNWVLDRERMDGDLVKIAVESGAEFFPLTPVTSAQKNSGGHYVCVCNDGSGNKLSPKVFSAPCLILADGVESRLAREFGWDTALRPNDIETCAFARIESKDINPRTCVFYTGSEIAPGGYLWIFPRGKNEANIGLGVIGSKSAPGLPKKLLTNFIKRKFPNSLVSGLHCGGVPVAKWIRPLVKEGVMLVGDAARQVNAVNGAGIAYSLYAGKTAGTIAAKSFRPDGSINCKMLREYQKQWASFFGKQQDRSFALKEFILASDDAFLDKIAESLSKEDPKKINYMKVFMKTCASRPWLLLKVIKLFK